MPEARVHLLMLTAENKHLYSGKMSQCCHLESAYDSNKSLFTLLKMPTPRDAKSNTIQRLDWFIAQGNYIRHNLGMCQLSTTLLSSDLLEKINETT